MWIIFGKNLLVFPFLTQFYFDDQLVNPQIHCKTFLLGANGLPTNEISQRLSKHGFNAFMPSDLLLNQKHDSDWQMTKSHVKNTAKFEKKSVLVCASDIHWQRATSLKSLKNFLPSVSILTLYGARLIRDWLPCFHVGLNCTRALNKHYYSSILCALNSYLLHTNLPLLCLLCRAYLFHKPPRAISVCYKLGNCTWWVTKAAFPACEMRKQTPLQYKEKGPVIAWSEICVSWHGRLARLH